MTETERPVTGSVRPTTIGPFNGRVGETNRTRTIPVPWIDCDACSLRHYPSTTKGRWHIATTCMGCGAELTIPEAPAASPAPAPGA
jgi:hypothetical protein